MSDAPPTLPARSGVSSLTGKDAVLEADTAEFLAWLRARGLPEQGQLDVAQMDRRLQGFQRTVLRYGVVKALLEKGYPVPRDAAAWAVFDAAMRLRLQRAPGSGPGSGSGSGP